MYYLFTCFLTGISASKNFSKKTTWISQTNIFYTLTTLCELAKTKIFFGFSPD